MGQEQDYTSTRILTWLQSIEPGTCDKGGDNSGDSIGDSIGDLQLKWEERPAKRLRTHLSPASLAEQTLDHVYHDHSYDHKHDHGHDYLPFLHLRTPPLTDNASSMGPDQPPRTPRAGGAEGAGGGRGGGRKRRNDEALLDDTYSDGIGSDQGKQYSFAMHREIEIYAHQDVSMEEDEIHGYVHRQD